jgi:hypothetical protein
MLNGGNLTLRLWAGIIQIEYYMRSRGKQTYQEILKWYCTVMQSCNMEPLNHACMLKVIVGIHNVKKYVTKYRALH